MNTAILVVACLACLSLFNTLPLQVKAWECAVTQLDFGVDQFNLIPKFQWWDHWYICSDICTLDDNGVKPIKIKYATFPETGVTVQLKVNAEQKNPQEAFNLRKGFNSVLLKTSMKQNNISCQEQYSFTCVCSPKFPSCPTPAPTPALPTSAPTICPTNPPASAPIPCPAPTLCPTIASTPGPTCKPECVPEIDQIMVIGDCDPTSNAGCRLQHEGSGTSTMAKASLGNGKLIITVSNSATANKPPKNSSACIYTAARPFNYPLDVYECTQVGGRFYSVNGVSNIIDISWVTPGTYFVQVNSDCGKDLFFNTFKLKIGLKCEKLPNPPSENCYDKCKKPKECEEKSNTIDPLKYCDCDPTKDAGCGITDNDKAKTIIAYATSTIAREKLSITVTGAGQYSNKALKSNYLCIYPGKKELKRQLDSSTECANSGGRFYAVNGATNEVDITNYSSGGYIVQIGVTPSITSGNCFYNSFGITINKSCPVAKPNCHRVCCMPSANSNCPNNNAIVWSTHSTNKHSNGDNHHKY